MKKTIKIAYSPERINPGDRVHTLTNIKKIVSGMDFETCAEVKKVYDIVIKAGTFPVSTIKTAEAVKVVENSQRDINIAFVNDDINACNSEDKNPLFNAIRMKNFEQTKILIEEFNVAI